MKYFRPEEEPGARLPQNFISGFLEGRNWIFRRWWSHYVFCVEGVYTIPQPSSGWAIGGFRDTD